MTMLKVKDNIKILSVQLLIFISLFIFFEVAARILTDFKILQYTKPLEILHKTIEKQLNNEDWRLRHAFTNESFEFDRLLFWRPRKNYGAFNKHGFKGEYNDKRSCL